MKLKLIQLITTKNTPSLSNEQNPRNADRMGISGVVLCLLALKWLSLFSVNDKIQDYFILFIQNSRAYDVVCI